MTIQVLEAIFRGNLSAVDLVCPTDPEYKKLNHEVVELTERLTESMSPADKALLNKLISTIYSAQLIETESYFTFGFSTGMALQKEAATHLLILKG